MNTELKPAARENVMVHETAVVDEPCDIGAGTKIWHFTHVMRNCRIGERCNFGQNVVVSPDVTVGNDPGFLDWLEMDPSRGTALRDADGWIITQDAARALTALLDEYVTTSGAGGSSSP